MILNAFHSVSSAKNRVSAILECVGVRAPGCTASLSTAVIVQTTIQNTCSKKSIIIIIIIIITTTCPAVLEIFRRSN